MSSQTTCRVSSMSSMHRSSRDGTRGLSGGRVLLRAASAVVLLICLLLIVGPANVSATGVARPAAQEPVISGLEELWINVTRMCNGKACAPTARTLEAIVQSYRTGDWRKVGEVIYDARDKTYWQKLQRPRYTSVGGAVYFQTWHYEGWCMVDNYTDLPTATGPMTCDCWDNYTHYFLNQGYVKPAICYGATPSRETRNYRSHSTASGGGGSSYTGECRQTATGVEGDCGQY